MTGSKRVVGVHLTALGLLALACAAVLGLLLAVGVFKRLLGV